MKKRMLFLLVVGILFSLSLVLAADATVCCEKTTSGLFCQDVPAEECAAGERQAPTACESTSFCKPGYCYDSSEGTCMDSTPQVVCNENDGIWSEEFPPQCELGCCTLGDQASFVTLVRCKRLSAFLGLETNYNSGINDEVQCVLSVLNQDRGACVFESDFERTCQFTTRSECSSLGGSGNSTGSEVEFYEGFLCSDEELGTNCGPTSETRCGEGKDEVYFVDSCGNTANIYDATKVNDKSYWSKVVDKAESCSSTSDNAGSNSCGNCNYLLGSVCRDSKSVGGSATYGDYMCADLNCESTSNGKSYRHGESWCVNNDEPDSVGSRFYRHICINGEEVVEQCEDFRQYECLEDEIETVLGDFSQAACRVNRWQDCTAQLEEDDCLNSDRRDCDWVEGEALAGITAQELEADGVCLPENSPGLQFWEGEEAQSHCSQGDFGCIVTYEEDLFGDEECVDNCHCLEESWEEEKANICTALGDCGPKVNWIGDEGSGTNYEVTIEDA
tara:strand:+ start:767 stop:2275 length:1509 start_codon:yes stop_codon:yes gene_type:complete